MNHNENHEDQGRFAVEMRRAGMRRVAPTTRVVPGRATRAASWVGWHVPEITGVGVPAAVAVSVSPWAWLLSAVVGAGWTVQAVRTARKQVRDQGADAAVVEPVPAATPSTEVDTSVVEGDRQVGGVR